jgi:hypothetical protein
MEYGIFIQQGQGFLIYLAIYKEKRKWAWIMPRGALGARSIGTDVRELAYTGGIWLGGYRYDVVAVSRRVVWQQVGVYLEAYGYWEVEQGDSGLARQGLLGPIVEPSLVLACVHQLFYGLACQFFRPKCELLIRPLGLLEWLTEAGGVFIDARESVRVVRIQLCHNVEAFRWG